MVYNLMTCGGFSTGFMEGCGLAWLGIVMVVFIGLLCRKWIGEEGGIDWNMMGSFLFGGLGYVIIVTISGSAKWSILVGLVGLFIGGFLGGALFGGGSE